MARTGGLRPAARLLEETYLKGVKYGFHAFGGTEGFYGISMSREDMKEEILTFVPITVFYEFIKEEEMHNENPRTYLLSEVRNKYLT